MADATQGEETLIGRLEAHVGHNVEAASELGARDPAFIASIMPGVELALRWFDPEVRGFERLPEQGPFLIVANHSGGVFMPDHWAFLREWVRRRGPSAPLYSLGLDFLFSIPGAADFARRLGAVPAAPANADRLLEAGAPVLVYPGGDEEDYRPWTERHRVDLQGHTGFVRLALRHGVPVVPVVSHGSHACLIVVARGHDVAHALHLDRLRVHVLPVVLGPNGLLPLPAAGPPFPSKVICQVCEPFDWASAGPDAADDPATVRRCYDDVVERMQTAMDDLVAEVPHPVRARLADAFGINRLRRLVGPT